MSNLYVFIPFNKNDLNSSKDLPEQAYKLQSKFNTVSNKRIGENIGVEISNVSVVFMDTEFNISPNDYIIVFAHGNETNANNLYSNDPDLVVEATDVIEKLEGVAAYTAIKILFMCCYSALENHIAQVWLGNYNEQTIYGSDNDISKLFGATRNQIKDCCLALYELD